MQCMRNDLCQAANFTPGHFLYKVIILGMWTGLKILQKLMEFYFSTKYIFMANCYSKVFSRWDVFRKRRTPRWLGCLCSANNIFISMCCRRWVWTPLGLWVERHRVVRKPCRPSALLWCFQVKTQPHGNPLALGVGYLIAGCHGPRKVAPNHTDFLFWNGVDIKAWAYTVNLLQLAPHKQKITGVHW